MQRVRLPVIDKPQRPLSHYVYTLFGLLAFATAQPVYDLLKGNPQFLVVHDLDLIDICVLLIATSLGPILLATAVLLVARRAGSTTPTWAFSLGVLAITSFGFWQLLRGINAPLTVRVGIALLSGCLCMWGLLRSQLIADLAKMMAWAGVIFPILFIVDPKISAIYFGPIPSDRRAAVSSQFESLPPIVLVVFDELSLWTLVGADGTLNHHRYPNFSRLAEQATWFPNAGTVVEATRYALPAILTGQYPRERVAAATLSNFPNNLFSWLQDSYRLVAVEYATRLCPEQSCEEVRRQESRSERWLSTASDVKLMLLHRVFPPEWVSQLPSVEGRWRDFVNPPTPDPAVDEFLGFIESIDARDGKFYFIHSRLPHVPWNHTAQGAQYTARILPRGVRAERWNSNSWLTVQGFQRHIVQTQFADRLLGRLLDRLEREEVFDRALIIVMADHGVSFRPNMSRRSIEEQNYDDIVAIPFFVKRPSQRKGQRIDRPVESIDVPATIADVLGTSLSWASDGHSVFDSDTSWRLRRRVASVRDLEYRSHPPTLSGEGTILRKLSLFGSGEDPESIFRVGDRSGLVGRSVSDLDETDDSSLVAIVQARQQYRNVRLESGLLPVWMRGKILGHSLTAPLRLAIALNGTIVATTETFVDDDLQVNFRALLPERRFAEGSNDFKLFVIPNARTGYRLGEIPESEWAWRLQRDGGQLDLVSFNGDRIPVQPRSLFAELLRTRRGRRRTSFVGWAVDRSGEDREVHVAFFQKGSSDFVVETSVARPNIARKYLGRATDVGKSGFRITVPNGYLTGKDERLFAFTSKSAVEIPIPRQ